MNIHNQWAYNTEVLNLKYIVSLDMEECRGTSGIILRVVKQEILYLGWLRYTTQCRGFINLKKL